MNLGERLGRFWQRLRGQPVDEHDEQLMRLYWNRAELKKEMSSLQNERHNLLAKLESHQTALRRASEQVDELAAYLGRPEVGPQALLYFQLRSLWLGYSGKLAQFVAHLRAQIEDRERSRHRADCQAKRAEQLAEMDGRILDAQSIADSLRARIKLLNDKLETLRWFWHYRRRKEVRAEIGQAQEQWEVAATNITDLSDERAAIEGAPLDDYPGLSVLGKRIVNTSAIGYAEWLITNLPHRNLALLARHAISVQIFDAQLGSAQDCLRTMKWLEKPLREMAKLDHLVVGLREPTERIRSKAVYRGEHDTVPLLDSIGDVPTPANAAETGELAKVNVLADDYWSIAQVLVH